MPPFLQYDTYIAFPIDISGFFIIACICIMRACPYCYYYTFSNLECSISTRVSTMPLTAI